MYSEAKKRNSPKKSKKTLLKRSLGNVTHRFVALVET